MNSLKIIVLLLIFSCPAINFAQENTSIPERTPELEAAKQTEKMQQELNLSAEQTRQVHEVNLKYARARKISNTRMEAIQRIKDKEVELSRILSAEQHSVLQNKRYERSTFQSNSSERMQPTVRESYSHPNNRQPNSRQPVTAQPGNANEYRSTYRSSGESRSAAPAVRSETSRPVNNGSTRSSSTPQSSSTNGRR